MPYRDERDALEHRCQDLAREIADLAAREAEIDAVRARLAAARAALADANARLADVTAGRARSPLDDVSVASPCDARWEDMTGDARARFCGQCKKYVYNLSAMPRAEAEAFLVEQTGEVCVRLFRRADGTVLTADCNVGARRRRGRRVALVVLGGGAVAAAGAALGYASTQGHAEQPPVEQGQVVMGEAAIEPHKAEPVSAGDAGVQARDARVPERVYPVMGRMPLRNYARPAVLRPGDPRAR